MKTIKIKGLDENIYFEKLDNGLEVYLYPKENVHSNFVTFTTKYGSVYNEFIPIGGSKMMTFPKGIAHFLEHKVFVQKEDPQPMEYFASVGADCNAYTFFKNTTYHFTCVDNLENNINYLLDYVQNLYVTDKSIENEKGIISEEIHMYEDNPNAVLGERVRKNILKNNPYKDSVIGEVSDIKKITKDDLETCYNTFYHPSNMFIVVCGDFDPNKILDVIKDNQSKKNFLSMNKIKVKEFTEDDKIPKKKEIVNMNTEVPKVSYTIKIPLKDIKLTRRQIHLYMYILFNLLFDEASDFDTNLKKDGVITDTTYISMLNVDTHILISLLNETKDYERYFKEIEDTLDNIKIDEKDFIRKKKVLISNELFAYESLNFINDLIMDNIINTGSIEEDPIGTIRNLKLEELLNLIKKIDFTNSGEVVIKKK